MKCKACGYENEYNHEIKGYTGDEKFISIEGNFTCTVDNGYSEHIRKVGLYACPKCHTVIMDAIY